VTAGNRIYQSTAVFGISSRILELSYVDRGELDKELQRLLQRPTHIALKGESKCGKSWLRQRNIPNAITVQCRLNRTVLDLYVDALSQLGIRLTLETANRTGIKGTVEGTAEGGWSILAKVTAKVGGTVEKERTEKTKPVGQDINDLRFIADIIRESGRRLVIEDYHYLSQHERAAFAFDLKALWDYECFVVIIGIWPENNMLLALNPDLSGRVTEVSIYWSSEDLYKIILQGTKALNIEVSRPIAKRLVEDSFGTAGVLQALMLKMLDEQGIEETGDQLRVLDEMKAYEHAAWSYADQLNAVYQSFASRVARGIRARPNSTGIYAHSLAVILDADDETLLKGMHLNDIYSQASEREPRVQKGNLRQALDKMDELQIDDDGRGLVLTYDGNSGLMVVVDKQLLFYRKYASVHWPWEQMVASNDEKETLTFGGEK